MAVLPLKPLYALLALLSLLHALCAADAVRDLQTKGRAAIDAALALSPTCTNATLRIRKEWFAYLLLLLPLPLRSSPPPPLLLAHQHPTPQGRHHPR